MAQQTSSLTVVKSAARSFIEFLNKSVTPFHGKTLKIICDLIIFYILAVDICESILLSAGFKEVLEKDNFSVNPGDKYFIKK